MKPRPLSPEERARLARELDVVARELTETTNHVSFCRVAGRYASRLLNVIADYEATVAANEKPAGFTRPVRIVAPHLDDSMTPVPALFRDEHPVAQD